ncbi:hypothetical protein ACFL2O_11215 [Thermodesulfobacteriota bacterium]
MINWILDKLIGIGDKYGPTAKAAANISGDAKAKGGVYVGGVVLRFLKRWRKKRKSKKTEPGV